TAPASPTRRTCRAPSAACSAWPRPHCRKRSQFVHEAAPAAQYEGAMREHLLTWQWENYDANHRDRTNLAIHIATVPLFILGSALAVAPPLLGWIPAPVGLAACAVAVAAQGRGHRGEKEPPIPFDGPGDAAARLVVEQWITFPRFVLSGGFARA